MDFAGKTVVITGGASGIGAAMARKFCEFGAEVCICDLDREVVDQVARKLGCLEFTGDVTREEDLQALVEFAENGFGPIDIFVSNAGIMDDQPGHSGSASDAVWMRSWSVHVMAHVHAARLLLPGMIARGSGYFVNVASAAGLLSQIGNAAYSATKHAAVSFAQSLAIEHGDDGIGVSVVCPQYVATPLIGLSDGDAQTTSAVMTADAVAECIVDGVRERRFMILPHPEVYGFFCKRAEDPDRWIRGMQKLRRSSDAARDPFSRGFSKPT